MITNEIRNRIAKATRCVEALDKANGERITAEDLAQLHEESWVLVGALTGGRPISDETRNVALIICRAREAGLGKVA